MMADLKVGDLVRDKLNAGENSYGLGIITRVGGSPLPEEDYPCPTASRESVHLPSVGRHGKVEGTTYNVYFTRFGKTIEFHGDYLEKVR